MDRTWASRVALALLSLASTHAFGATARASPRTKVAAAAATKPSFATRYLDDTLATARVRALRGCGQAVADSPFGAVFGDCTR